MEGDFDARIRKREVEFGSTAENSEGVSEIKMAVVHELHRSGRHSQSLLDLEILGELVPDDDNIYIYSILYTYIIIYIYIYIY